MASGDNSPEGLTTFRSSVRLIRGNRTACMISAWFSFELCLHQFNKAKKISFSGAANESLNTMFKSAVWKERMESLLIMELNHMYVWLVNKKITELQVSFILKQLCCPITLYFSVSRIKLSASKLQGKCFNTKLYPWQKHLPFLNIFFHTLCLITLLPIAAVWTVRKDDRYTTLLGP